ncbi:MAG: hypothetical protein IJF92_05415 [Bacilli bacterium]|nr:hypothetical protein [Bacilli bacterium]
MLDNYEEILDEYVSNLEDTIELMRNRYNNGEELTSLAELNKEEEALLIQIDMTKGLKKDLNDLFSDVEKAKSKINLIENELMADEDDEDVLSALNKSVDAYNKKISRLNEKILAKAELLERITNFNNIELKNTNDLSKVKEVKLAKKIVLTKEQMEHITNAISNPRIFNRVAEAKGINIKSRSKVVKEEKEKLRKEVFEKLQQLQKGQDDLIDIKQVLTDLYGADFSKKKKKIEEKSNEESNIVPVVDNDGKEELVDDSELKDNSKEEKEELEDNNQSDKIYIPENFEELIKKTMDGLGDLSFRKDDNKYKAINYKCKNSFYDRVHNGNFILNAVSVVRGGVISAAMRLSKKKAQLTTTEEDMNMYKELKERINNWSDEQVLSFSEWYSGNDALNLGVPLIFNTILEERKREIVLDKVGRINEEIVDIHNKIYDAYEIVKIADKKLEDENLSEEERKNILDSKNEALKGKAELISRYYEINEEGKKLFNDNKGPQAQSQTNKALRNRGSKIGKRLSKGYSYDSLLGKVESELKEDIIEALNNKDDEVSLRKFVEFEQLEIENTKIERTALGTRSVGKRYFDPLVKDLDYSDDTLVRDIIMTVGSILTVWNVGKAVTNSIVNGKNIADYNHNVEIANNKNKGNIDYVNNVAHDVVKTRGKIQKGMEAQANSDLLNGFNVRERASLDGSDWNIASSIYHNSDHANHGLMEKLGDDLAKELGKIEKLAKNGNAVDPSLFTNLAHKYNNSFADAINDSMGIAKAYAARHSSIELDSCLDSMAYLKHHVKDIADMNVTSLNNTYAVEALQNLSVEKVNAISGISDNLKEVLIQAGVAGTMIVNSAIGGNTLSTKYGDYGYGNSAIDRIEKSIEQDKFSNIEKYDDEYDDEIVVDSNYDNEIEEENEIYDDEVYKEENSISKKERVKDALRKVKRIITEPVSPIYDENLEEDNKSDSPDLASVKKSVKNLVDSKSVAKELESNNDNISVATSQHGNVVIVDGNITDIKIPKGFHLTKDGKITNKGNTDSDKYTEFMVFQADKLNHYSEDSTDKKNMSR